MPEGSGQLISTDINLWTLGIRTGSLKGKVIAGRGAVHWELNEGSSLADRTNGSTIIYDDGRIYDGPVNENKQPNTY